MCRYSKNIIDRVRAHETTKMSSSPLTQPTKYIIKRFKNKTRRNKNIDNAYVWNATDVSPIPDAARVSFIVTVIVHYIEKKKPKNTNNQTINPFNSIGSMQQILILSIQKCTNTKFDVYVLILQHLLMCIYTTNIIIH